MKRISGLMKAARGRESAFTLVELLIVAVVGVILMAGMVSLITAGMNQMTTARSLSTITDSGRRALPTLQRQVSLALRLDDTSGACNADQITFWGDIDGDNSSADVDHYSNAEKVRIYKNGSSLTEEITEPAVDPDPQGTAHPTICGNVESVSFTYYQKGSTSVTVSNNYNDNVGMVRVSLNLNKGRVSRAFKQDIFLRILNR
jgi:competence protein ComGC